MVGPVRKAIPPLALGMSLIAPLALAKAPEYSIPFADRGGIRNWQADGSKGVWIQATGGKWYYAGFSSPCSSLPFSEGIRFLPDPTGDLSRWSSIRLAHAERCFFRSLQPSAGPPQRTESPRQIPSSGTQLESNVHASPISNAAPSTFFASDVESPCTGLVQQPVRAFLHSSQCR